MVYHITCSSQTKEAKITPQAKTVEEKDKSVRKQPLKKHSILTSLKKSDLFYDTLEPVSACLALEESWMGTKLLIGIFIETKIHRIQMKD